MKTRVAAAVLVLTTACATTKASGPGASDAEASNAMTPPAPALVQRQLPSVAPMQIVSLPVPNKPITSLRLVFRAGSVDDPKGKEGLTALTTNMLSEGGTEKLSSAELIDALFPMAAELSGSTDKEFTVFSGRVHKDKLDAFLAIFTDVLLHPRFDPKDFERMKEDALNALTKRLRGENDEGLSKAALDSLLYPGHPYRHPTVGTEAGLKSITLDDVKAQWRNIFTQDRLVLGLAGATDVALETKVRTAFAALPPTGVARAPIPPAPTVARRALIVQRDTLSTAGDFGASTQLRRGDPDFFAVALAMSYLGEHRQQHGVLFTELREKRGLNYGTYAYAEHYAQEGWGPTPAVNVGRTVQDLSIWLRPVEPKNGMFATRSAMYFFHKLLEDAPDKEQFATARGFLLGATRLYAQTDQRRLGYAIDDVLYGTADFLGSFRKALEAMTPEAMSAAAKKHLRPKDFSFAFVTKDADGLKAALTSGAETPISYPTPKPEDVLKLDKVLARHPVVVDPAQIETLPATSFMAN